MSAITISTGSAPIPAGIGFPQIARQADGAVTALAHEADLLCEGGSGMPGLGTRAAIQGQALCSAVCELEDVITRLAGRIRATLDQD